MVADIMTIILVGGFGGLVGITIYVFLEELVKLWRSFTYSISLGLGPYNHQHQAPTPKEPIRRTGLMHLNRWNSPSYKNVMVLRFIEMADDSFKQVTRLEDNFTKTDDFEWSWLLDEGEYGWKQKQPPPKPFVIFSAGALPEVDRILPPKFDNENGKYVGKVEQYVTKKVTFDKKDGIEEQNPTKVA